MSTLLASLMVPAVSSVSASSSSSLLRPRMMSRLNHGVQSISSMSTFRKRQFAMGTATLTTKNNNNHSDSGRWKTLQAFQQRRNHNRSTSNHDKLTKFKEAYSHQARRLPWTPICETHMELSTRNTNNIPNNQLRRRRRRTQLQMMNPNLPSEGFRDAHRGAQEYIKPSRSNTSGDDVEQDGGSSYDDVTQSSSAQINTNSTPNTTPSSSTNEQHLFQQRQSPPPPPSNNKGYGFPKLQPGRQRNYKSPMTEASSALQQSFRRKNVVSSLERVVYPSQQVQQQSQQVQQQQQQQQQLDIQQQGIIPQEGTVNMQIMSVLLSNYCVS